jgi:acyl-CoA synthetase (AMP-forming)/AMP-acid ligase II
MTESTQLPRAQTLPELLRALVAQNPSATATIDVVDTGVVFTTRSELRDQVDAIRDELETVGVRQGQCIAILLPNWSDTVVWQFAAAAVGAHIIGVNTRYNTSEIAHILVSTHPSVIVVAHDFHDLDLIGRFRTAAASAVNFSPPPVAVVSGPSAPKTTRDELGRFDLGSGTWYAGRGVESGIEVTRARPTPDTSFQTAAGLRADPGDPLAVAFTTSGSTGTPKLAAHRGSAVVHHAYADAAGMGVVPGDVSLCVLPLSGVFGFSAAMGTLAGGGALLMEPVFDAEAALLRMQDLHVTHVVGGDDLFGRLYDTWRDQTARSDLRSLKWLGIADFLGRSHDVARWARDEFGAITTGVYGSSEIFALMMFWNSDDPESLRWNGGGRPVSPEIRVRIADPGDDTELPDGEQGELQVWGPNVVDAYLGNAEAAARAFSKDGWFRSGDLAVAGGDGGFTFVCRMGDALRLRGFLVDPAEIEHRLAAHTAVVTAKVVGISSAGGYTDAIAFVVLHDDAQTSTTELKSWCAATLAAFKVPKTVHVISEMPTTVGGNGSKIRAVELREWARSWADDERDCQHVRPHRV